MTHLALLVTTIVTATCYHAVAGQCNDDYLTTASGKKIESTENAYDHRYVAASRDLLADYPYGTAILVTDAEVEEYNGIWYVEDTMNKRFTETIDFLINPDMQVQNSKVTIQKIEQ